MTQLRKVKVTVVEVDENGVEREYVFWEKSAVAKDHSLAVTWNRELVPRYEDGKNAAVGFIAAGHETLLLTHKHPPYALP